MTLRIDREGTKLAPKWSKERIAHENEKTVIGTRSFNLALVAREVVTGLVSVRERWTGTLKIGTLERTATVSG